MGAVVADVESVCSSEEGTGCDGFFFGDVMGRYERMVVTVSVITLVEILLVSSACRWLGGICDRCCSHLILYLVRRSRGDHDIALLSQLAWMKYQRSSSNRADLG